MKEIPSRHVIDNHPEKASIYAFIHLKLIGNLQGFCQYIMADMLNLRISIYSDIQRKNPGSFQTQNFAKWIWLLAFFQTPLVYKDVWENAKSHNNLAEVCVETIPENNIFSGIAEIFQNNFGGPKIFWSPKIAQT